MLTLENTEPGKPLLLHDEPIYDDDKIIGRTTSGNYSFCFNKKMSFGYIFGNHIIDIQKKNIFIEIEKYKYKASIITKPLNNKNIKVI